MNEISRLESERLKNKAKLPRILASKIQNIAIIDKASTSAASGGADIAKLFPNSFGRPIVEFAKTSTSISYKPTTLGVILSGGQAPGGHNVIAGLFDALKEANEESILYGFLGGPGGLVDGKYIEISKELVDSYRNTGGFDIIGSGRTKLEKEEQFIKVKELCNKLGIEALVIIGGDDSNTNAALLAEYFMRTKAGITVVGCPKTIDGDLKNKHIEVSFGFDTAAKTYSELIGNLQRDALSAKKYWHFIRLMGRSASHITLECALNCHPNIALISEEIQSKKIELSTIVDDMFAVIVKRAKAGKNYGTILIPEGVIEFLPNFDLLISQLNDLLVAEQAIADMPNGSEKFKKVASRLDTKAARLFSSMPATIQGQLLADRDPHGNVQVSRIDTEKLFIELIEAKLAQSNTKIAFSSLNHFFGYEGRCGYPSNFDADYCTSLGRSAYLLAANQKTGYIACIRNLELPQAEWIAGGIPVTMMMNMERRHGADKPVIKKALVELDSKAFKQFSKLRSLDLIEDDYLFPGPIQYYGPVELCDKGPLTLKLEKSQ